ncbi:alkaline phosphatase synthesis sensor protein PhoR [Clostridium tepidiprofundi DSM 19306]|uniref:histidine kinase n=1 Tax=Clostridium tepidiprofundi DSM 19306 TaxID=1121338 RepID=A0A151B2Q3_9CLOT|nr:HAMP domain-containing sensor histidine kinase [Clostridium tepidiprofundi]KYH34191.1 alkaline phosphatase synthesis sensor protein PhoR [Clostridium tepidiprofundi DSM 19306]
MRWKITLRFVTTIIFVVIIVTIINIVAIMGIFINNTIHTKNTNPILKDIEPENFVRNFNKYILSNGQNIFVNNAGKKALNYENTWIQILDEDGKEVYAYKKPKNVPLKYTPFQIIHGYKYRGVLGNMSTIFIGEKYVKNKQYSYIIGFPMQKIERQVLVFNIDKTRDFMKNTIIIVLLIDSIIALFFAYLFSRKLTKPIGNIINGVVKLGNGDYNVYYTPKGVYSEIYHNINNLSDILKSNTKERMKLDKMREEWIVNISHDIKTPLASIKGYAEILSNDDYEFSKEEIKSYANIIHKKSDYIKELVDDLNLATKLKNKASILRKKETNLVRLTRETIIDILNDSKFSNSNINFISKENIILKKVDNILLKRAISNLLYNALIHNNSSVNIEVEIIKQDNKVHIFIKDNGKGIKPEELKYIFDRYYRGTNTSGNHKGSGLGMAITREIIKAHGGDIKINSILRKGTEIEIILP